MAQAPPFVFFFFFPSSVRSVVETKPGCLSLSHTHTHREIYTFIACPRFRSLFFFWGGEGREKKRKRETHTHTMESQVGSTMRRPDVDQGLARFPILSPTLFSFSLDIVVVFFFVFAFAVLDRPSRSAFPLLPLTGSRRLHSTLPCAPRPRSAPIAPST